MKDCDKNIIRAINIVRELNILADEGEAQAEDDSCILLYSIIRDCAYKIKHQAQQEMQNHQKANF